MASPLRQPRSQPSSRPTSRPSSSILALAILLLVVSACSGTAEPAAETPWTDSIEVEVGGIVDSPPNADQFLSPLMQERLDELVQSDLVTPPRPVFATRVGYGRSMDLDSDGNPSFDWRRAVWAQTPNETATIQEISTSLLQVIEELNEGLEAEVTGASPYSRLVVPIDFGDEDSADVAFAHVELHTVEGREPSSQVEFTLLWAGTAEAFSARPAWVEAEAETFVPLVGQLGLEPSGWDALVVGDFGSALGREPSEEASDRGSSTVRLEFGRASEYGSNEDQDSQVHAALAEFARSFGVQVEATGYPDGTDVYLAYDTELDRSMQVEFFARSSLEDSWLVVEIQDSVGGQPYELD